MFAKGEDFTGRLLHFCSMVAVRISTRQGAYYGTVNLTDVTTNSTTLMRSVAECKQACAQQKRCRAGTVGTYVLGDNLKRP
jgi:hypothetical protein